MLVHAHPGTVSRWENGVHEPDEWQTEIMAKLQQAVISKPEAADSAKDALVAGAIGVALGILLAEALKE